MPKKPYYHSKINYILTAKDRYKPIWVSRGDHPGMKWSILHNKKGR